MFIEIVCILTCPLVNIAISLISSWELIRFDKKGGIYTGLQGQTLDQKSIFIYNFF